MKTHEKFCEGRSNQCALQACIACAESFKHGQASVMDLILPVYDKHCHTHNNVNIEVFKRLLESEIEKEN